MSYRQRGLSFSHRWSLGECKWSAGPGWGWFLWVKSPNSGAEMHTERVGAGAALLAPADDDKMAHFCQLRTERLRSSTSPAPPCTLLHTTAVWGPGAAVSAADCCRLGRGLQTPWTRTQGRDRPRRLATQSRHLETISTADTKKCELWSLCFTGRNIAISVTSDWGHSLGEKCQADWSQAQGHD